MKKENLKPIIDTSPEEGLYNAAVEIYSGLATDMTFPEWVILRFRLLDIKNRILAVYDRVNHPEKTNQGEY